MTARWAHSVTRKIVRLAALLLQVDIHLCAQDGLARPVPVPIELPQLGHFVLVGVEIRVLKNAPVEQAFVRLYAIASNPPDSPGLAIDFLDLSPKVVLLLLGELIRRLFKALSQHQEEREELDMAITSLVRVPGSGGVSGSRCGSS